MKFFTVVMSVMIAAGSCVPAQSGSRTLLVRSTENLARASARAVPDSVVEVAEEAEGPTRSARSISSSINDILNNIRNASALNNETNINVGEIKDRVYIVANNTEGLKDALNGDFQTLGETITSGNQAVVDAVNAIGESIVAAISNVTTTIGSGESGTQLETIIKTLESISLAVGSGN